MLNIYNICDQIDLYDNPVNVMSKRNVTYKEKLSPRNRVECPVSELFLNKQTKNAKPTKIK